MLLRTFCWLTFDWASLCLVAVTKLATQPSMTSVLVTVNSKFDFFLICLPLFVRDNELLSKLHGQDST